jgi:Arc/MetJ family transcription regulator
MRSTNSRPPGLDDEVRYETPSCDAIQAARAALHLAAPDALSGIPRGLDVNDVEARAVHLDDTVECRRRSALSTA